MGGLRQCRASAPPPTLSARAESGKEPLRFDSFRFRTFSKIDRFGSVRFGKVVSTVRRGSACALRTRRGSVLSGSVRFRVRFRPIPKLNGSVRFGSIRPVRFGFLSLPDRHRYPGWASVRSVRFPHGSVSRLRYFGRGDDTVGNPHRAQISQFELFELMIWLNLDKQFPVEQFEASRAIRGGSISVSSTLPPS